ncbi:MAG: UDP-N-acetylglucosamine 2-epimerase (non-hydrolyzing) [Myxococcota bacterium]|nr:UDP-N-acetylglucosamine 2-epimerase (non-hydrolyzing) [Myxococcota bacterium]
MNPSSQSSWSCVTVLGARPQFIKAAPLSEALRARGCQERIIHTGQHYDPELSKVFFEELKIPAPAHHLGIAGGGHSAMVGRMLIALEAILVEEQPDIVLVYGDTNSTLAGALAAAQLNIPVAHVEAGLRSYRLEMPEEKNRRLTDHLSSLLFCPTARAVELLKREGISDGVSQVGDLMYDMALKVESEVGYLDQLELVSGTYDVMTLHRAEVCDKADIFRDRLQWLIDRQKEQARPLIWPIHPRSKQALARVSDLDLSGITRIAPVSYRKMATLLRGAAEVYTDSGGLQREAFFHQVPCVTLRDESEWPETIEAGWNRLWAQRDQPLPPLDQRHPPRDFGAGDAGAEIAETMRAFCAARATA